jgi:hypothetical protein
MTTNVFYYDSWGFLTDAALPGREVTIEPPQHGEAPVVGEAWPNWTGESWEMVDYFAPIQPTDQGQGAGNPNVPEWIPMWKARCFLIQAGKIDDVNTVIDTIPDQILRDMARAKFEYSSTMRRDDPLLANIVETLQWPQSEVDQFFIEANALT